MSQDLIFPFLTRANNIVYKIKKDKIKKLEKDKIISEDDTDKNKEEFPKDDDLENSSEVDVYS